MPVKPNKNNYWNDGQYEWANYAEDLEKHADHLEKELEEVKSKAFIPFKVKVDFNFAGLSAESIYVAHYEHSDCYFIEKPNGKMDYIHKSYCKKIS